MRTQSHTVNSPKNHSLSMIQNIVLDKEGFHDNRGFRGSLEASKELKIDKKINIYDMLVVQRKHAILRSMKYCGYRLLPDVNRATYAVDMNSGRKRLTGTQRCDNQLCPKCSKMKGREKANTLAVVASDALSKGKGVFALTQTIPHAGMTPTAQVRILKASDTIFWRRLKSYFLSKGMGKIRFGKSYDETIRPDFSVHIHKHSQIILDGHMDITDEVHDDVFQIWQSAVSSVTKGKCIPLKHGFFMEPVYDASLDGKYSSYVFKFNAQKASMETMSSRTKSSNKGWTLVQLMDLIYRTGSEIALRTYRQILRAYQGTQYHNLSKGMKDLALEIEAANALDRNDEADAQEPEEDWIEIRFIKEAHYAIGLLGLQSAVFRVLSGSRELHRKEAICLDKLRSLNEWAEKEEDYTLERAICDFGALLWDYRSAKFKDK